MRHPSLSITSAVAMHLAFFLLIAGLAVVFIVDAVTLSANQTVHSWDAVALRSGRHGFCMSPLSPNAIYVLSGNGSISSIDPLTDTTYQNITAPPHYALTESASNLTHLFCTQRHVVAVSANSGFVQTWRLNARGELFTRFSGVPVSSVTWSGGGCAFPQSDVVVLHASSGAAYVMDLLDNATVSTPVVLASVSVPLDLPSNASWSCQDYARPTSKRVVAVGNGSWVGVFYERDSTDVIWSNVGSMNLPASAGHVVDVMWARHANPYAMLHVVAYNGTASSCEHLEWDTNEWSRPDLQTLQGTKPVVNGVQLKRCTAPKILGDIYSTLPRQPFVACETEDGVVYYASVSYVSGQASEFTNLNNTAVETAGLAGVYMEAGGSDQWLVSTATRRRVSYTSPSSTLAASLDFPGIETEITGLTVYSYHTCVLPLHPYTLFAGSYRFGLHASTYAPIYSQRSVHGASASYCVGSHTVVGPSINGNDDWEVTTVDPDTGDIAIVQTAARVSQAYSYFLPASQLDVVCTFNYSDLLAAATATQAVAIIHVHPTTGAMTQLANLTVNSTVSRIVCDTTLYTLRVFVETAGGRLLAFYAPSRSAPGVWNLSPSSLDIDPDPGYPLKGIAASRLWGANNTDSRTTLVYLIGSGYPKVRVAQWDPVSEFSWASDSLSLSSAGYTEYRTMAVFWGMPALLLGATEPADKVVAVALNRSTGLPLSVNPVSIVEPHRANSYMVTSSIIQIHPFQRMFYEMGLSLTRTYHAPLSTFAPTPWSPANLASLSVVALVVGATLAEPAYSPASARVQFGSTTAPATLASTTQGLSWAVSAPHGSNVTSGSMSISYSYLSATSNAWVSSDPGEMWLTLDVSTSCPTANMSIESNCQLCNAWFASPAPPCDACVSGRFGAMCDVTAAVCRSTRCNNRGECTEKTAGCTCDSDSGNNTLVAYGAECEILPIACNQDRCGSNYDEDELNPVIRGYCSGQLTGCMCVSGWDPAQGCAECRVGYNRSTVVGQECTACLEDRYGDHCEMDPGQCTDFRCNYLGVCTGRYSGCDCLGRAVDSSNCLSLLCSGHGTLVTGVCQCDNLYELKGTDQCVKKTSGLAWWHYLLMSLGVLIVCLAVLGFYLWWRVQKSKERGEVLTEGVPSARSRRKQSRGFYRGTKKRPRPPVIVESIDGERLEESDEEGDGREDNGDDGPNWDLFFNETNE